MANYCESSCDCSGTNDLGFIYLICAGAFKIIMTRLLSIVTRKEEQKYFNSKFLLNYVEEEMEKPQYQSSKIRENLETYRTLFRELHRRDERHTPTEPNFSVLSIHARLGLEDTVLEMITGDTQFCAEARAIACEFLQVAIFDGLINSQLSKMHGLRPNHKLTYFRMAQEIRDAEGITRKSAPAGKCFSSLNDIIAMEKQIEEGSPTEFLVQCCWLGLVDSRHFDEIFASTSSHSKLVEFYVKARPARRVFDDNFTEFDTWFSRRFEMMRFSTPEWHETLLYLKSSRELGPAWHVQNFGVENIPEEMLDVFLNHGLRYLVRCIGEQASPDGDFWNYLASYGRLRAMSVREISAVTKNLDLILKRGASLYSTFDSRLETTPLSAWKCHSLVDDEDSEVHGQCKSSPALLLKIAMRVPSFPFSTFQPLLCCPMTLEGTTINFDRRRPARLSCLAARACKRPEQYSRIPRSLSAWVVIHREFGELIRKQVIRDARPLDSPLANILSGLNETPL